MDSVFADVGLSAYGIVDYACLQDIAMTAPPAEVGRYGLLESSGAMVALLPYDPRPVPPAPEAAACSPRGRPMLSVGAFAAFNRYATLRRLLGTAGRAMAERYGLSPKSFRVLVNSRLPEKRLATSAGLGFIGRSSLVISDAYGPACVVGVLLLPPELKLAEDVGRPGAVTTDSRGCGACTACADACPTGAIARLGDAGPGLDLGLCIQYWTTAPGAVPAPVRAAWGSRLYGCDTCVAACPHAVRAYRTGQDATSPAASADALATPDERRPGRLVPISDIAEASDQSIKALFRRTALGMSWIPPELLRRNAALASSADVSAVVGAQADDTGQAGKLTAARCEATVPARRGQR